MILADKLFRAQFGLQKYNSNSNAKKQNKQNRFKLREKKRNFTDEYSNQMTIKNAIEFLRRI